MLRKFIRELGHREIERLGNQTIYFDCVVTPVLVLDGPMVAVIIVILGNETVL